MIMAKKQEQKTEQQIIMQNETIETITLRAKLFNLLINFRNKCASIISSCE